MSDRRCGALLRTSLTLTRHSLTRKGPCEGEIKVRNTSLQEARRGFSAVRFRFARRSVAPERRCKRKRYAYASRTVSRTQVQGRRQGVEYGTWLYGTERIPLRSRACEGTR